MKLKSVIFFFVLAPFAAMLFSSCDKCSETGTIEISAANQYFSVTYVDTAGTNYLNSIYNINNVSVLFNDNGGQGQFVNYSDSLADGKFGPFPFSTEAAIPGASAAIGANYDFWYICKKDTFGTDTFRVVFYPTADECKEFWGQIEYYKNGELLDAFSGAEICDLTITE